NGLILLEFQAVFLWACGTTVTQECTICHQTASPITSISVTTPGGSGSVLKWFTEFGHLNRGDMLTSEHYRCLNEKKKFQCRV
ncbi:hypothetical protein DP460_22340, partial [Salmonella enterica]|nr:hypothetical protein [Salmonella enterica]